MLPKTGLKCQDMDRGSLRVSSYTWLLAYFSFLGGLVNWQVGALFHHISQMFIWMESGELGGQTKALGSCSHSRTIPEWYLFCGRVQYPVGSGDQQ